MSPLISIFCAEAAALTGQAWTLPEGTSKAKITTLAEYILGSSSASVADKMNFKATLIAAGIRFDMVEVDLTHQTEDSLILFPEKTIECSRSLLNTIPLLATIMEKKPSSPHLTLPYGVTENVWNTYLAVKSGLPTPNDPDTLNHLIHLANYLGDRAELAQYVHLWLEKYCTFESDEELSFLQSALDSEPSLIFTESVSTTFLERVASYFPSIEALSLTITEEVDLPPSWKGSLQHLTLQLHRQQNTPAQLLSGLQKLKTCKIFGDDTHVFDLKPLDNCSTLKLLHVLTTAADCEERHPWEDPLRYIIWPLNVINITEVRAGKGYSIDNGLLRHSPNIQVLDAPSTRMRIGLAKHLRIIRANSLRLHDVRNASAFNACLLEEISLSFFPPANLFHSLIPHHQALLLKGFAWEKMLARPASGYDESHAKAFIAQRIHYLFGPESSLEDEALVRDAISHIREHGLIEGLPLPF